MGPKSKKNNGGEAGGNIKSEENHGFLPQRCFVGRTTVEGTFLGQAFVVGHRVASLTATLHCNNLGQFFAVLIIRYLAAHQREWLFH